MARRCRRRGPERLPGSNRRSPPRQGSVARMAENFGGRVARGRLPPPEVAQLPEGMISSTREINGLVRYGMPASRRGLTGRPVRRLAGLGGKQCKAFRTARAARGERSSGPPAVQAGRHREEIASRSGSAITPRAIVNPGDPVGGKGLGNGYVKSRHRGTTISAVLRAGFARVRFDAGSARMAESKMAVCGASRGSAGRPSAADATARAQGRLACLRR